MQSYPCFYLFCAADMRWVWLWAFPTLHKPSCGSSMSFKVTSYEAFLVGVEVGAYTF